QEGKFYFLEMNTRLQVEHPVTEQVTGVDLVRLQIELALDPKNFQLSQIDRPRGHSIEVRIYAEDPSQSFMPTPGTVRQLRWPTGTGIRVESGIEEGQTIGIKFDSMLAKLIVYAPDRAQAISRMRFALDETVILGMGSNHSYLRTLCDDNRVLEGRVHTHYLEEAYGSTFAPVPSDQELVVLTSLRQELRPTSPQNNSGSKSSAYPSPWFGGSR
ncbi:MAG: hypothetical protein EOP09_18915, partial [Proteobacteria bacterium]